MTPPAEYPRDLAHDVRLKDGSYVHVRPVRPDDAPRLEELYGRLSRDTAYHRFFTVMKRLPPDWAQVFATVDYRRRLALVAERDSTDGVDLVGVGRYEPTGEPDTVEVAFVVEDEWQGRGLGTILVREVLDAAAARGIHRFRAYVLTENRRMLDLVMRFGNVHERKTDQGVTDLLFTRREDGRAGRPGGSRRSAAVGASSAELRDEARDEEGGAGREAADEHGLERAP